MATPSQCLQLDKLEPKGAFFRPHPECPCRMSLSQKHQDLFDTMFISCCFTETFFVVLQPASKNMYVFDCRTEKKTYTDIPDVSNYGAPTASLLMHNVKGHHDSKLNKTILAASAGSIIVCRLSPSTRLIPFP